MHYQKAAIARIEFAGFWSAQANGKIATNLAKEVMRIADAESLFKEHAKEKFKHNAGFVDANARNALNSKNVTTAIIRYSYSFNQCRVREAMIKQKSIGLECSWCSKPEIQDHAMKCSKTKFI